MDRRKVLLITAALIAVLGTLLVFLYVRSADKRADERYGAVQVLRAVKQIDSGESVAAAKAAGKIELGTVGRADALPGALSDLAPIDSQVAVTTIYPGEQIVTSKFGTAGSSSNLSIPDGMVAISVNLTDPARVAGFVNPGNDVAIFMNGTGQGVGTYTRLLLPKVKVIGVGATTPAAATATTTTAPAEQLPRTLLTLGVTQAQAEKVLFASKNGDLAFALLTKDSKVAPSKGATEGNLFN